MSPTGSPVRGRQMLTDYVYELLLALVVDGRVAPGESLNIEALSREFDVSATPIREALARLESTGMVVRVALRGYQLAPLLTREELELLMDARLVIEPVHARLAAGHVTPELLEKLRSANDDLHEAPQGPTFAEFQAYFEADERFHHTIADASGNPFLRASYLALGGQAQRFRLFGGHGVTDADDAFREHRRVLEAIGQQDPIGAENAMASHIAGVRSRVLQERQHLSV